MSVFHIVASRPIRKITAAAAVLFFLLLALIPGTLRAQIDSREGIILVVASYNPDTRRMSGFISDFEQAIVQKKVPYEIVVEDMGCKGLSEAPQWQERMRDILDRYRKNKQLKAVVLLGQEV